MSTDLLRLATVGSVDDGKSTLIGRLLVDTRQLFDDQLHAVAAASRRRGVGDLDLSFVTDGLRAEREQGITIDVAYRYAQSPTRKFVIADCPGHVQYTRNMATGASTADVALVVLDVNAGVKEQTRRHLCIAALLGVHSAVVAVNKIDTVNWSEAAFTSVVDEVTTLTHELGFTSTVAVPVSALLGDNVVEPSKNTPWYHGPSVLRALEESSPNAVATTGSRLAIQWVLRQNGGGRTYAGQVSGSPLRVGDAVTIWPQGVSTTISSIHVGANELNVATSGLSVDVGLADDTDAGRGDMIASDPAPSVVREFTATVCWFVDRPLAVGDRLVLKHTTRSTPVRITALEGVVNLDELCVAPSDRLLANDIGVIDLAVADELCVDPYRDNRTSGSFVLIDPATNATLAAGLVGRPGFVEALGVG